MRWVSRSVSNTAQVTRLMRKADSCRVRSSQKQQISRNNGTWVRIVGALRQKKKGEDLGMIALSFRRPLEPIEYSRMETRHE